jgi:biopolymer transport protein TolQ
MESIVTSGDISSAVVDFSLLSLFLRADLVVKSVIIILMAASIYSWAVIVEKLVKMKKLKQLENEFDEIFWSGNSFEDLFETFNYNQSDPKSKIFCSAISEWKKTNKYRDRTTSSKINALKERMNRSMQVTFNKESEVIEKNLTFLATAGSTAPFIGLFGTVWGIMNSFQSIAIAQNTNLAVVAPGIAEALFATALGLFVAIPAVVAYNKITSDLSKYFISLETFIDEFTTIFFRQLEEK